MYYVVAEQLRQEEEEKKIDRPIFWLISICFVVLIILFFLIPHSSAAENFSLGLGTLTGKIELKVGLEVEGLTSSPKSRYPERDAQGNLWVEKGVRDTKVKIPVPKDTGDIRVKEGILFSFSQDQKVFTKMDLVGKKIPFLRPRYQQGTATIMEYDYTSEKVLLPILDWKVSGESIYTLDTDFQISEFDATSGEYVRTLPFPTETGIGVEGNNFYVAGISIISCFNLSSLERQWTWHFWSPQSSEGFGKMEVRKGVIYAVSDDQIFQIKIGKFDLKKKEVRQSTIVSTLKSTAKIVDFLVSNDKVITLDEKGVIQIYDLDLDPHPLGSFQVEGGQAIEMEENRLLYVLTSKNLVRVLELEL